ncbi:hypothetical protein [Xenophilus sp. Marseille-Q4582]|uniref:hypothetical protein n=1 Tax=Xenophilus sp. Marseille-Q4582 TaxID=2866600 RepID=UPI001CE41E87|nr:hypothetical protein [Xenophilus sp. Marseille-Q4582]
MLAGSLEIELMANMAKLKKDMDEARKLVGDFSDFTKKAAGVAAAALAAVGIGLSVSSFMGWIKGAIDAANAASDMAKRMGVATKEVAGLQLAFQFSDVQGDAMVATMGKLSQAISGGNKALDAMGIKTKTAGGQLRDTKDVLYESADVIASMADGAAKNALVLELFGKQGLALIPMLNDGSEGMREMADMAERLGLVVSDETGNAAAEFNDTLDLIKLSSQGVAQGIAAQVLPTLQTLTGQFFETLTEGDNLRKVSDFLAASMKILYSVGVGVVQVFSTVGKTLGAAAAQVVALLSGDFKGAKAAGSAWVEDMKADWTGAAKTITAVWTNTGDATVATMAGAAKKGREIRMQSDAEKAAADKAALDAMSAQVEKIKALDKVLVAARKDALDDIALAVKLGKATEEEAIEKTLTRELSTVNERIALVERERAVRKAAGQLTLKDAEQLNGRVADLQRAEVEARRKADSELALLDKARLDALDARAVAQERAAQTLRTSVQEQQRQNQLLGLEYANAAQGAAGSTAELARQVAELERSWAYEAAAQLERQAVTQDGIDLSGRTSAALREQAAATRALADLKFDAAGTKGAIDTLRDLDAYLDPAKPKDFGTALKDAFGEAGNALAQLANAFQDYTQLQAEWDKKKKALDDDKSIGPEERAKREIDLARKSAQIQVGTYASVAGAMKGFFKEHSRGYKAMQAAEQAFRAFEIAQAIASMTEQLFGIGAVSTAKSVANAKEVTETVGTAPAIIAAEEAKTGAKAKGALTAALNTLWPVSIVAFAAVAALLAGIGAGGSAGAGGGGYTGIAAGGTGTVLGMEGEASQSIANAIDLLAENSRIELTVSQRMLSELTKVREGIAGLAGDVSKDFFIRGMAGASFGDDFLDSGVGFLPGQTVADIIGKGIQGFGFNLIFQKGAQAMWRELDPAFKDSVGSVLGNIADTILGAAELLGLADGGLADRMLSIIPTLGDTSTYLMNGILDSGGGLLSFKDKSGKEIQEELEAVFSSVGDQMAAAALPALKPFQQIGEGMFETLVRVTTGIEQAEYALERYGIEAINYADIVRKNGDVAVEIVRQSVMALEPVGSGVAQIIDVFTGELADLLSLYQQLRDARGLLRDIGVNDMLLGVGQVRGAGGIDPLLSGLEAFRDNFFSEEEQVAAAWDRMAEQFAILGVAMPRTNAELRAFALGLDQTTEEGAQLFGGIMALAGSFADLTSRADDLAEAQRQLEQAELDRIAAIEQAHIDSWNNVKRAFDGVAEEWLDEGSLRQYRAERIRDQLLDGGLDISVQDILGADENTFKEAFRYLFELGTDESRNQATALLGVWSAFKKLLPVEEDAAKAAEDLAKALAEALRVAQAATDAAYNALQTSINAEKAALQAAYDERVAAAQEAAQREAAAAQDRLSAITSIFHALDAAIGSTRVEALELTRARRAAAQVYLQGALAAGQSGQSLAGFAGLENALRTVAEPSEDLYTTFEQYAIDQARTSSDIYNLREIAAGQMSTAEMTLRAINSASEAQLKAMREKHEADLAALDQTLAYWRMQIDIARGTYQATMSVGQSISALAAAIAAEDAARAAVNGSHATGLASVPFDGYVAELHRGERVLTAQDNAIFSSGAWARSGDDSGAVVAELRELRAEVNSLRAERARDMAESNRNTATAAEALDDAATGRRALMTEPA